MTNDKTKRFLIPGNFTSVLEQCGVGINKPLQERLKKAASDWRLERSRSLPSGSRLPCPKRSEILNMLQKYGIDSKCKLLVADSFSMRT